MTGLRGFRGKFGLKGVRGRKGPKGPNGKNKKVIHERPHAIGVVIDAATGLVVPGARLTFMQGSRPRAACRSGDNGRYYAAIDPGEYKIKAVKPGYYAAIRKLSMRGTQVKRRDIVMSPKLLYGQSRIVLTWMAPELHLDMFLVDAGGCVVSGYNKRCKASDGGIAIYEQEKCSGHGPQSILVSRWSPILKDKYLVFVRQTSRIGRITKGHVVIRVVFGGKTRVYRANNFGKIIGTIGKGRTWCAVQMDGKLMGKNNAVKGIRDCSTVAGYKVNKKLRLSLEKMRKSRMKKEEKKLKPKPIPQPVNKRTPKGVLGGNVINVLNGKPVPYATVTIKRDGRQVKELTASRRGAFFLRLPYASYVVKSRRAGFIHNTQKVVIDAKSKKKTVFLSPLLKPGQLRFVLTWSTAPKDLDSFLRTPTGCTVWYRKRFCHRGGQRADLDLDNTHGKGPETITIRRPRTGVYKYYVKQYSRHGNVISSSATVRVFFPDGRMKIYRVGKFGKLHGPKGRGRLWVVACVNAKTGAITNGASPTCTPPTKNLRRDQVASRRRRKPRRALMRRRRKVIRRKTNVRIRVISRKNNKIKRQTKTRIRQTSNKIKRQTNIRIKKGKPPNTRTRTQVGTARIRKGAGGTCTRCNHPSTYLKKQDYHGADLAALRNIASPKECCNKCEQTKGCKYWTYGTHAPKKRYCWLKHSNKGHERQTNRESGHVCKKK